MPEKSCGNCAHCVKMQPTQEGLPPLWMCYGLYLDIGDEPVDVTPPHDEACDLWEEAERE